MSDCVVELRGVGKSFGTNAPAVRDVSLAVPTGAFAALLGPSGCGKTTTLRLIAGLETPDTGEIWLAGSQVFGHGRNVPPEKRGIGMVFQDYALFPHLTVRDNVSFALNARRGAESDAQVSKLLALVGLAAVAGRYPHELSGGQQQRVALARALAPSPRIVLLDEPFSNLDAALRRDMRHELRAILRDAGVTSIFVTHDQEEALSTADVITVMFHGSVVQTGTPHDLYLRPANPEVACFLGEANMLHGAAAGDVAECVLGEVRLVNPSTGRVQLMVRPEDMALQPDAHSATFVERIAYYGHDQLAYVRAGETQIMVRMRPMPGIAVGARVRVVVRNPVLAYAAPA